MLSNFTLWVQYSLFSFRTQRKLFLKCQFESESVFRVGRWLQLVCSEDVINGNIIKSGSMCIQKKFSTTCDHRPWVLDFDNYFVLHYVLHFWTFSNLLQTPLSDYVLGEKNTWVVFQYQGIHELFILGNIFVCSYLRDKKFMDIEWLLVNVKVFVKSNLLTKTRGKTCKCLLRLEKWS